MTKRNPVAQQACSSDGGAGAARSPPLHGQRSPGQRQSVPPAGGQGLEVVLGRGILGAKGRHRTVHHYSDKHAYY